MYDETGENITAYTAELTQGYVVVSAYVDMPSPILEWAAEGEPYYKQFEEQTTYSCLRSPESQVIYLGGLNYLLDIGDDTVLDVQGEEIPREELNNPLDDLRSEENVGDELLTEIVLAKDEAGISPLLNGEGGNKEDEISNPFTFAKNVFYRTNWTCKEFKNYWGDYIKDPFKQSQIPNYQNACGPIAITNMLKAIGKEKYNSKLSSKTYFDIFFDIEDLRMPGSGPLKFRYYDNSSSGGVHASSLGKYAYEALKVYDLAAPISGTMKTLTPQNTINSFKIHRNFLLVHLDEDDTQPYGQDTYNHIVLAYAFTTLECGTLTKTFVKICDGVTSGNRYILTDQIRTSEYYDVTPYEV